jgi:hypothetical protein
MKQFASYEKNLTITVQHITHTVRILLNTTKGDLAFILKDVPDNATVTMIVDDSDLEGYGEIIFEEQIVKEQL